MIKRNLPKPGCACAAARIAVILCMTAVLCLAAWGCVRTLNLNGQKKNVEYVICKDSNLPDQLKTLLEEKKKNPGTFTYRNSRYIYLVVCYGKRAYSGYSVKIEECWRSEETLFLRTQLMVTGRRGRYRRDGHLPIYCGAVSADGCFLRD